MRKNLITVALGCFAVMSLPRFGSIAMSYDKQEDVPEAHKELYTERDGKWFLTGVEGGGFDNVTRLQGSLDKERKDHKETKGKYAKLNGKDIDDLLQRDSEYDELKLRADKVDDEKINQIVDVRVKQKLAPVERERDDFKTKLAAAEEENGTLKGEKLSRSIRSSIRKAAVKLKAIDTAVEDIEVLGERLFEVDESGRIVAKDGVGITPGIDPEMWLGDQVSKRPHWFPGNVGGGSGGSRGGSGAGGANPWSHDGWNMTEQGKILREDRQKAERMAAMHGVDLKNPKRPAKK